MKRNKEGLLVNKGAEIILIIVIIAAIVGSLYVLAQYQEMDEYENIDSLERVIN